VSLPVAEYVWLLILASVTAAVVRWIRIPYTVALVLVGLAVSGAGLLENVKPTADVILLVFLPPLLFQAALDLDVRDFGRALPVILLLAVPGVLVSAVLIGLPLAWLTPLTIWPALLFGSFISATDPVAVVSTFRRLDAPPALTHIIEGESLFNDGTALVLSTVLLSAATTGRFGLANGIFSFLWSVAAGALIGAALGYLVSEITGLMEDPLVETTLSADLAYGSYLLGDAIHASGAIAVVMAGMVYGNHGRETHVSEASRRTLDAVWEYVGFLANAVLFISIGLAVSLGALRENFRWVLIAIAVALAVRALVVYPLTLALHRISLQFGHVLFWGGLRGGVALAIALSLPATVAHRDLMVTMTFGVVLFTIVIQGTTIEPLARRVGVLGSSGSVTLSTESKDREHA
jgi:CPA1 family monovalent cation:H+ antiporter